MAIRCALLVCSIILAAGCSRPPAQSPQVTRHAIWTAIQPHADRYRFEATFIYALVAAESNFDPLAENGEARGLLQLKPNAWKTVSSEPYEPAVWDWEKNLTAGIDYLAWCRHTLHAKRRFSYPLVLAAYHYGIERIIAEDFELSRFPAPANPIYRELWKGNLSPLSPPNQSR